VNLGLIPAWGGTTRLPRLVGLRAALDVILKGRGLDARRATRIGLVDRVLARARSGSLSEAPTVLAWQLAARGNPLGRALLFSQARKRVLAQTKGHYPALLAAIEILRRGRRSEKRSFELEAEKLRELLPGTVAKSLVHLFFLNEQAKKDSGVSRKAVEPAGLRAARDVFEQCRKCWRMRFWELEQKMTLITPTLDWSGFGRA
jgi:3-hydroxyacyl-CoA dehydrogenase/enoyl-CoA hydratase/3-hydroxybutyryl-CoA epimerase